MRWLMFESLESRCLLSGSPVVPLHLDANHNGVIAPDDALQRITECDSPAAVVANGELRPTVPLDVLAVVNDLNAHGVRPVLIIERTLPDGPLADGQQVLGSWRITSAEDIPVQVASLHITIELAGIDWHPEHWFVNGQQATSFYRDDSGAYPRFGSPFSPSGLTLRQGVNDIQFDGTVLDARGWLRADLVLQLRPGFGQPTIQDDGATLRSGR